MACLAGPLHAPLATGEALIPSQAVSPGELRWTGDDAFGRWSLVALAKREAADPFEPGPERLLPLAAMRQALGAENAASRVAFDAQRFAGPQRWSATFFASRAALALHDEVVPRTAALLDDFDSRRAQRTRYGTTLAMAEPTHFLGIAGEHTIALVLAGETRDARMVARDAASGAEATAQRTSLAETRLALEARQSFELPHGIRLSAGARLEHFRSATDDGRASAFAGTRLVPMLGLDAPVLRDLAVFARAQRGDDNPATLAAIDPWRLASNGYADPSLARTFGEAGLRWRTGGVETRFSAWQSRAPSELTFAAGAASPSWPGTARHGYGLGFDYRPLPWLAVRGDLLLDLARGANGPALPGAPRTLGTAGASLKMSRDWNADLAVGYLGRRDGLDESQTLSSAALVNGQVVYWFGRTTRLSFHVFNVMNHRVEAVDAFSASRLGWQEGAGETFLASPAEPRAFFLKFRTRF